MSISWKADMKINPTWDRFILEETNWLCTKDILCGGAELSFPQSYEAKYYKYYMQGRIRS
jgi:hypothetical protein